MLENVNDGHNMEEVFLYADQLEPPEIEVWVDPLASNYEAMVSAIIIWVPDPRLLPDYES